MKPKSAEIVQLFFHRAKAMAMQTANRPAKKTSGRWEQRFQALQAKIIKYDSKFNMDELRAALDWARNNAPRAVHRITADDHFSDALTAVETVVRFAKESREIVLATPLISSMYRRQADPQEREALLQSIEDSPQLGPKVRTIVEQTLDFMSLNVHMGATPEDIKLFVGQALWAAQWEGPIVIRAGQLIDNLDREARQPGFFDAETRERLLINAQIYSELTLFTGHEDLRSRIMDTALRVGHPTEYDEIYKIIGYTRQNNKWGPPPETVNKVKKTKGKAKIKTKEEIEKEEKEKSEGLLIDSLSAVIEKNFPWERKTHFKITYREKTPGSVFAKAIRKTREQIEDLKKERGVESIPFSEQWPILKNWIERDLADTHAVRFELLPPAMDEMRSADEIEKSDLRTQRAYLRRAGLQANVVYAALSKTIGRGNYKATHTRKNKDDVEEKFSPYQEKFGEYERHDPRDADGFRREHPAWFARERKKFKFKDARFANYIVFPKPNGYESIHDMFGLLLPGMKEPLWFEMHILDHLRHRNNTQGLRTHSRYKIRANGQGKLFDNWYPAANAFKRRRYFKGTVGVVVRGPNKKLYDMSEKPTVESFLIAAGLVCKEVEIIDPFNRVPDSRRTGSSRRTRTFGPSTELLNGMQVSPYVPR